MRLKSARQKKKKKFWKELNFSTKGEKMSGYKKDFTEFLLSTKALKFGDFVTKSGRNSPYFINIGDLNDGACLEKLGSFYAKAIASEFGKNVDVLLGPAYKGIPIAVMAAAKLNEEFGVNAKYCSIRKEIKDHGDAGVFLGAKLKGGEKVVIVEDVTTAGTSIRETMDVLKNFNVEVLGLVVSVDRMEKGAGEKTALTEIAETFGFKTMAIVNLDEILDVVKETLSIEQKGKIAEYREIYGAK